MFQSIVSKGYYSSANPNEIRGYHYDPNLGGGIISKTYPSKKDFELTEIDLEGDAEGIPNYYIVYIFIRTDQIGDTQPQVDCEGVESTCGDESCDKWGCGGSNVENAAGCNDCLPHKTKVLRLDGVKVLTDVKGSTSGGDWHSYRESYMSGKYEIAAKYMIVKQNGTREHGYAYCNNELGQPTKYFGSSTEVVRQRIKNGNHRAFNNGVATYKTDVKILTTNFNPATDNIYIMFFELDRDWIGGDGQYKYQVLRETKARNGTKIRHMNFTYRSTDPPFGQKYDDFDHTRSLDIQKLTNSASAHVYEINAGMFNLVNNKWVFDNSSSLSPMPASNYGIEFHLDYDN